MAAHGEQRAWVAGATGYTGRQVVEQLVRDGVDTVAHVRPDSARLDEWRARFVGLGARVSTTPWSAPALAEALGEVRPTLAFALLGTTRARMRLAPADSYESVDLGLTLALIDACRTLAEPPRLVYLSAAGVGPGSRSAYYNVRWRAEEAVRDSGLPFLIARPSFIGGPDRSGRPLERWAIRLGDAALTLVGGLGARATAARYHSLSGAELARGLIRLALDPAAPFGRTVHAEALRDPAPRRDPAPESAQRGRK